MLCDDIYSSDCMIVGPLLTQQEWTTSSGEGRWEGEGEGEGYGLKAGGMASEQTLPITIPPHSAHAVICLWYTTTSLHATPEPVYATRLPNCPH